ncbi:GNAT family N-acetyltransferase [Leeia sp.]|uniref:GNAT family N-acetyltransferase n=1 Tax=Leeia sp. TaxID=2884678 RepID=UPI0035AECEB0
MRAVAEQTVRVRLASPLDAPHRALIAELDEYLSSLYPPEDNFGLPAEALLAPNIRFLVVEREGEPVGCGAVVLNTDYAEVKRMYVRPGHRGKRLAERLLEALAEQAREAGCRQLMLEAGPAQPEALRLYARCGFALRGPFGDYLDIPNSIFMEKVL